MQHRLWLLAQSAHAAGDRADARIMLRMIEAVDDGDYDGLGQLTAALQASYRDALGRVPARRADDIEGGEHEQTGYC